ncbi:MAG: hypothetical protein IJB88_07580 [Clostridia bacterium]|nr:hypothetical protein [Clostridia bacterium]
MSLFRFLTSSVSEISDASEPSSTPWAFWLIVGLIAVGFVILVIRNFVIKKEEYYK